jgi:SAM-dependent methyltransferase
LIAGWGPPLERGRILEIGCADGFVTERLARAGFVVTAVDRSAEMLAEAGRRLAGAGLTAELVEADVNDFEPAGQYDAVLAMMWNLFDYADDPVSVLRHLAAHARAKVVFDVNPRTTGLRSALEHAEQAGFRRVSWRPLFIPQRRQLGPLGRRTFRVAERLPLVRTAMLRFKFSVTLLGET